MVGVTLGDLCIRKTTKSSNAYCQFSQGLVHKDYIYHLYDLFEDFCNSGPSIKDQKPHPKTNQVDSSVYDNLNNLYIQ